MVRPATPFHYGRAWPRFRGFVYATAPAASNGRSISGGRLDKIAWPSARPSPCLEEPKMPSWLRMSCRLAAWLLCLLLMACTSTTFLEPFDANTQRIGQIKVECDETACTGTGTSGETFRGTWARDYDTG